MKEASTTTTTGSSPRKKKKTLVIVESPAKARTIQKFFPSSKPGKDGGEEEEVLVDFCLGHIRDLMKQRDVPKEMKKENPDW
jgi:DNA topoisomerase IA